MPSGPGVLTADMTSVQMAGHHFSQIHLRDFLSALARKVEKRDATMIEYGRIRYERAPDKVRRSLMPNSRGPRWFDKSARS